MRLTSTLFVFAFLLLVVYAEVPEHAPSLDSTCNNPALQYSRGPIACKQANCPFPAGRTYTYDCNCGEAWDDNSTYIGCWENQILTKCIPRGDKCSEWPTTFDVITGNCATGYEYDQDTNQCIPVNLPVLKCTVTDLEGKPVSGAIIKYAVRNGSNDAIASDSSVTGDDGTYTVGLPRKGGRKVVVSADPILMDNGYRQTVTLNLRADKVGDCNIIVYNNDQVAKRLKADFTKFLTDACFPPDVVAKIQDAKIRFDGQGDTSYYDSQSKTLYINQGDLKGGWDEVQKAVAHEFGHWVVDNMIDESKFYVKGIPLIGKITGGPHNTWAPTTSDSWWVDPQKTAYDEATAEFFAQMYFRSVGKTYDASFDTPDKAQQVVGDNPGKGNLIEGAIATYLTQFYKNGLDDNSTTPAKAFGDFYQSTKKGVGRVFTRPPRTIDEFMAARNAAQGPWDCQVNKTGDVNQLANSLGLGSSGTPVIEVNGGTQTSNPDNVNLQTNQLSAGQQVTIPKDSGFVSVQWPSADKDSQGKIPAIFFDPSMDNTFKVSDDGKTLMEIIGLAYGVDEDIWTPDLKITHQQTEYTVQVTNEKETITVINGSVQVTDAGGNSVVLNDSDTVDYTKTSGFSGINKADVNSIINKWKDYGGISTSETNGIPTKVPQIPCCPALGAILLVLGIAIFRQNRV